MKFSKTNEIARREQELTKTSVLKKLDSTYEEYAKLCFIFDVSGSMESTIYGGDPECFIWSNEIISRIRSAMTSYLANFNAALMLHGAIKLSDGSEIYSLVTWETVEALKIADPRTDPSSPATFTVSDDELKKRICDTDLTDLFGVQRDYYSKAAVSKLALVRQMAKQEIKQRIDKFPDSQVAMVAFAGRSGILFDSGNPKYAGESWETLVDNLVQGFDSSDTNILAGIKEAFEACRQFPSPVGLHHFIIVSDGGDHRVEQEISKWIPVLQASGVVLDYIHIGDPGSANTALGQACIDLGGEQAVVNSVKDFETKFVEAATRKLLPSPANA